MEKEAFIIDSQAMVPGSRMFYEQPDATIRRAIVRYLAQGSGS